MGGTLKQKQTGYLADVRAKNKFKTIELGKCAGTHTRALVPKEKKEA